MRTPAPQDPETISAGRRSDLILVAAAALLVRALYFAEYRGSPFFDFIHLDPRYYHDWALQIAAGDWLGKEVFEQSPLYPYLLALYLVVAGPGLTLLRVIQFGAGAVTAALTCALGRRFFGRGAGIVAGIGAALYGPFLFYEGQVMKEFLTPLFSSAMLILLYRGMEQERPRRAFHAGAGVCIGLAALVRDNFLLLLPILGACLLAARGRGEGAGTAREAVGARHEGTGGGRERVRPAGARFSRSRWIDAGALAAGTLAVLLPVAWRNHHVAGEWVLTTSGGGEVFYIGNGPHANGAYVPPPWVRANPRFEHEDFRARAREITGRDLSRSEASRFWWGEGLKAIRDDPWRWVRLEIRKAALFLNDHELPDNYSFDSFRRFSWVLTLAPKFGWVAAFAAPGLIASAPRWRELALLYLAGAGYMASVMIFFNFARFRLPFVPILLVFAGHGAVVLWRSAAAILPRRAKKRAAGSFRPLALYASATLIVAALVRVDLHSGAEEPFQDRLHLGAAYHQAGRTAEAETILRETIRDAEAILAKRGWRPGSPAVPGGISFAMSLHAAHRDLARVLLDQKRAAEAIAEMNAAIPLDPNDAELFQMLGGAYRSQGDLSAAAAAYRRGLAAKPASFTIRFDLATVLHESGDSRAALAELLRAKEAVPGIDGLDLADWHYGMGAVLLDIPGREEEGIGHLREGLRMNPDHPQAADVRAFLSSRGSSGAP